jgi:hypothetical protein
MFVLKRFFKKSEATFGLEIIKIILLSFEVPTIKFQFFKKIDFRKDIMINFLF